MKRNLITLLMALIMTGLLAQTAKPSLNVIPEPVSVVNKQGQFTLPRKITMVVPESSENKLTVDFSDKETNSSHRSNSRGKTCRQWSNPTCNQSGEK